MPIWNIHSSSPTPLSPRIVFFSSLQMPILQCCVSDIGSNSASPLCATSGESLRRAFHLTVARLSPDASHLRHTAPASSRTICRLIDLSLVRSVLRILWGEKCILTDFLHAIVFETDEKDGGRDGKALSAPGGELAVMCLGCLKRAVGRGLIEWHLSNFTLPDWFVLLLLLNPLNSNCHSFPLLLPSGRISTMLALFSLGQSWKSLTRSGRQMLTWQTCYRLSSVLIFHWCFSQTAFHTRGYGKQVLIQQWLLLKQLAQTLQ